MASTSWNPSDKSAGITLTGSNLIATNSNNAVCGVRALDSQSTGKYYWEITSNVSTYGPNGIGIVDHTTPLTSTPATATAGSGICGLSQTGGNIYNGGVNTGIALGNITAGMVICIAVDLTARLIWFREGAAGNWNASGTANPATGVGGVSLPSALGSGIAAYPGVWLGNLNDQATANFGATAFTGAVPAGFTSGWPPLVAPNPNNLNAAWRINVGPGVYTKSAFGKGAYGVAAYSQGGFSSATSLALMEAVSGGEPVNVAFAADLAFAPIKELAGALSIRPAFVGNLTTSAVELAGALSVNSNLSAGLGLTQGLTGTWSLSITFVQTDMALSWAIGGSWSLSIAIEAPLDVLVAIGPLWADSELCPPPLWADSELCANPGWTPLAGPNDTVYQARPYGMGLYGAAKYGKGGYVPVEPSPWENAELCRG